MSSIKKNINDVLVKQYLERMQKAGGKSLEQQYPAFASTIQSDQDWPEYHLREMLTAYVSDKPASRSKRVENLLEQETNEYDY